MAVKRNTCKPPDVSSMAVEKPPNASRRREADQWLASARRGDRHAQGRLLEALQDQWFRFAFSQLGDEHLALDAAQETALRVLKLLSKFTGASRFETWTLGITLNVCRELRRSRREPMQMKKPPMTSPLRIEDNTPQLILQQREQQAVVHRMLDILTERQREVVVLRYLEHRSVTETAAIMQCAPGTVKATLAQAVDKLRKQWEPQP